MKIRNLANNITSLIEREMHTLSKSRPDHVSYPSSKDLTELFAKWQVGSAKPNIQLESDMMGAGQTIYIKFGPMYFAVLQNWDACPDGINRFLMVIPLYGVWNDQNYIHGIQEVPIEIVADSMEVLVNILADIHNSTL